MVEEEEDNMQPETDGPSSESEQTEIAEQFVVADIFPRNLVHLVAAPVGTGKTTLFMQQINAMQKGLLFLGKQAYMSRVVYISADRGRKETNATLKRLGMSDLEFKLVALKDMAGAIPMLEFLIADNCQRGDVVFIEPLNFFLRAPDGKSNTDINNYTHVSQFLLKLGREAESRGITIEGSLHSSKAKQNSQYMVAREKVIGSTAWTGFTATTIVIEPMNPSVVDDPGRMIHVMPRDCRPFALEYEVEPAHGLLIPTEAKKPFRNKMDQQLEAWQEETFTTKNVLDWANEAGVSLRTAERWLNEKIETGYVERVNRGVYRKRQKA